MNPLDEQNRVQLMDEARARLAVARPSPIAENTPAALQHDLQVHEIELEMQNEALREAKVSLEQSRDLYVELYEQAPVGFLTLNADGMIVKLNLTCAALLGVEPSALRRRRFVVFVMTQDQDRWSRLFMRLIKTGGRGKIELAIKRADGAPLHAQLNCYCPAGTRRPGAAGLQITLTDITERREAEDRLLLNEARTRGILEGAADAIFITDRQGRYQYVNQQASELLGYTHDELLTMSVVDITPAEDLPQVMGLFEKLLGGGAMRGELLLKRRDGGTVPVDFNGALLADGTVFGSCRDISESRLVKAALQQSEEFKDAILDSVSSQIAVLDPDGKIIAVNEAWRCFALENSATSGELAHRTQIGVNYLDICQICVDGSDNNKPNDSPDGAQQAHDGILAVLEGRLPSFTFEYPCHSPDQQRWFSMSVMPLKRQGHGVVITHADVTAAKLAEDERSRHRDALVREVHHRIKNNLQGVAGLLHRELGRFLDLDPRLETAISQIDAIAIIHGLQSSNSGEAILLCESARIICQTVSELLQRPVLFQLDDGHGASGPAWIESSEAVAIALVLNELILNAVKHSPAGSADPTVVLWANGSSALVVIRNAAAGVPAFDSETGHGLGTGLRLVRSLLPNQGAYLAYEFGVEGVVLTKLTLTPPVLVVRSTKVQVRS